jgi:hypothetical protein
MVSKSLYHNYYGVLAANPVPGPGVPNPTNGDLYYNSVTNTLMGYINGAWVAIAPVAAGVQESYAELYFYPGQCGDTAIVKPLTFSATCKNNPIAITALSANNVKGAPWITTTPANGSMTIGASGAGRYLVTISLSMSQTVGALSVYIALRRNGVVPANLANLFAYRNNTEANEYWTTSITGIVNAAIGDVFDIVVCVSAAATIRFEYVNFSMVRIGA